MFRVICDLCHKDIPNAMQPAPVTFCERCVAYADDYVAGVMRIIQDEATVQARRLENHRKEFLGKIGTAPAVRKLEVAK